MTDNEYKEYFKRARKEYRSGYDRMPIEELDLPISAFNQLKRNGINVYGEIRNLPDWKIAKMLFWNRKYLMEVKRRMSLFEVKKKPLRCVTPIETLGLNAYTTTLLKEFCVDSVEDLVTISAEELYDEFLGIRKTRLQHIRQKLAEKGLSLRDDPKPGNITAA
ncbi:MAG: hypothetical protein IJI78_07940 [Oscillospiraceae bacterium]|nr:hypothetical protein [Oscillospiraceae bacterium]